MEKELKILSQGFQGDRHVMTFEEAKKEIYDIALNDNEESELYLLDFPHHTISDFAEFIQCCFISDIENGYCHKFSGVTYQILNDEIIEDLWKELSDIPFDEDDSGSLILVEDWFIFDKGTDRDSIWHWFDDNYSNGLAVGLMGLE